MKLLDKHSISGSRDSCSAQVMDVAMWIVRLMRAEIRRTRPGNLSLTQVRALGCLEAYPDSRLSAVAEVLAMARPSASQLIDGLVRRGLVARRIAPDDRRQVRLRLTAKGDRLLKQAFDLTRGHLAGLLQPLSAADRSLVMRAMAVLRPLVAPATHPGASAA